MENYTNTKHSQSKIGGIARRIWIADQLDASEYDTIKFNEHLSVDEVHVIKQSIRVLENLPKQILKNEYIKISKKTEIYFLVTLWV